VPSRTRLDCDSDLVPTRGRGLTRDGATRECRRDGTPVQIRPWETNLVDAIRNTPLLVAQQSLLLARSRVVERHYSEVISPLLVAAEALDYVQAQEIGRHDGFGESAGWVRQEILDYTTRIETNNTNALPNIDAWLDQVSQWNERRNRSGVPPGIRLTHTGFHRHIPRTTAWVDGRHPRRLQR
jgi:hypothetical protein